MATAQSIIERSLRLIGAIDPEETAAANELANGLTALNSFMESIQLDRLMIFAQEDVSHALTASLGQYTIGATGAIVASRPIRIDSARIAEGGLELPLEVVLKESYDDITLKTDQGTPETLYYQPSFPNGTIRLYPLPSADQTLKLTVYSQLQSFASLGTTVALPPGYERFITFNLAIELAPEFGKSISQEVARIAGESKAAIKRLNNAHVSLTSQIEPALMGGASAKAEFLAGV